MFRESITQALPALLEALERGDRETRVAALEAWSGLSQDGECQHPYLPDSLLTRRQIQVTFREQVNRAAPRLTECLKDPDDHVRITALAVFSRLSEEGVF